MQKKAQIPVMFVFIFAIIVAGLLLAWGISAISRIIDFSQDIDYQLAIQELKEQSEKMFYYEQGSVKTLHLKTSKKIQQFCFVADKNKQLNPATSKDIEFLIKNSDYNLFIIPLDAFERTGFNIQYLRGKSNPECIPVKNNQLDAKLTTIYDQAINDNYVQIETL